jgi:hypothetical protein
MLQAMSGFTVRNGWIKTSAQHFDQNGFGGAGVSVVWVDGIVTGFVATVDDVTFVNNTLVQVGSRCVGVCVVVGQNAYLRVTMPLLCVSHCGVRLSCGRCVLCGLWVCRKRRWRVCVRG